jgi:hypothetical protein
MDTTTAEEEIASYNRGIFKWFSFTPEMVQKFSIDPKSSCIVRKELKMKLALENVSGVCKTCGWKSKVAFGNPSNWVRHLLVS